MRISDWSSDVCSSDLDEGEARPFPIEPAIDRLGDRPGHRPHVAAIAVRPRHGLGDAEMSGSAAIRRMVAVTTLPRDDLVDQSRNIHETPSCCGKTDHLSHLVICRTAEKRRRRRNEDNGKRPAGRKGPAGNLVGTRGFEPPTPTPPV